MTEIVDRLRTKATVKCGCITCLEAADEIERLRAKIERLKVQVIERDSAIAGWIKRTAAAEVGEQRAERLRLELEKIAWMDEFLDADGAKAMMNIAREAINNDNTGADRRGGGISALKDS